MWGVVFEGLDDVYEDERRIKLVSKDWKGKDVDLEMLYVGVWKREFVGVLLNNLMGSVRKGS